MQNLDAIRALVILCVDEDGRRVKRSERGRLRHELEHCTDRTSDAPVSPTNIRDFASAMTHKLQPSYDTADSVEEIAKVTQSGYWNPSLESARHAMSTTATQIKQQAKALYDMADAAETANPVKESYWRPSELNEQLIKQAAEAAMRVHQGAYKAGTSAMATGLEGIKGGTGAMATGLSEIKDASSAVATGSTTVKQHVQDAVTTAKEHSALKAIYDAADAVEQPVLMLDSQRPEFWSPQRNLGNATTSTGAPRVVKDVVRTTERQPDAHVLEPLTTLREQSISPSKSDAIRPLSDKRGTTQLGMPVPTAQTEPSLTQTQPNAESDQLAHTAEGAQVLPSHRKSASRARAAVVNKRFEQSADDAVAGQRESTSSTCSRCGSSRQSSSVQHDHRNRRHLTDNCTAVHECSCAQRWPSRYFLRNRQQTSPDDMLPLETQGLDRALIKTNELLEKAIDMLSDAARLGRHREIINIVNATNDTFSSTRPSRPAKAHLSRCRYTRLEDDASLMSLASHATRQHSGESTPLERFIQDVIRGRETNSPIQPIASHETMVAHASSSPAQGSTTSPREHPAMAPHVLSSSIVQAVPAAKLGQTSESTGCIIEQADLDHPPKPHMSVYPGQEYQHKQRPIAREWSTSRKRLTAAIACSNTVTVGLLAGIYAGEVPAIQYQIADLNHRVVLGNVLLYIGMAVTTMLSWPLPLLHGRKPYNIAAFAIMLPLQYPQALTVQSYHDPDSTIARIGLLLPRALAGLAMGFANINFFPTLLDLYGASLMSDNPHQEHVQLDDIRRQGGGIGLWLGLWSWCYIGSLSLGFCIGACIISDLNPEWGFYITIILLAVFLLINIIAPETRPAPYRRSVIHVFDHEYQIKRRVAKGEVHLHLYMTGPHWWFEEVLAGIVLSSRMLFQAGFFIMNLYFAWIYAQVVLIIILLGALLSTYYAWTPDLVGLASLALAMGALLAIPLTHANVFSRSRIQPPRTNSMTFHHGSIKWTSHMLRRCVFTLVLPLAGLAYTLVSPGPMMSWVAPVLFAALVGFLSNLAITECVGLIMETFDTCDLQAGSNNRHREASLPENIRQARTHYSAYPRVCAAFFTSQSLGFLLAACATGVSGAVTRALGAQISSACVAGILLILTVLLLLALLRWHAVQVVPDGLFKQSNGFYTDKDWRPVVLGNPSGKTRRMNLLETGKMSRWSEIRRLNGLET